MGSHVSAVVTLADHSLVAGHLAAEGVLATHKEEEHGGLSMCDVDKMSAHYDSLVCRRSSEVVFIDGVYWLESLRVWLDGRRQVEPRRLGVI